MASTTSQEGELRLGRRVAACGLALMYMLRFWVSLFGRAPDSSRGPDSSLVSKSVVLAEIDVGHHVTPRQKNGPEASRSCGCSLEKGVSERSPNVARSVKDALGAGGLKIQGLFQNRAKRQRLNDRSALRRIVDQGGSSIWPSRGNSVHPLLVKRRSCAPQWTIEAIKPLKFASLSAIMILL